MNRIIWRICAILIAIVLAPTLVAKEETPVVAEEDKSYEQLREEADRLYGIRNEGLRLLGEKKYDEAYPFLVEAARNGFKVAQAQLGFLHEQGLGGAKKDARYAIGWLGVAADGVTDPQYRKYFKDKMKQVPKEHEAAFQKIVNTFVSKYGTDANRVKCKRVNRAGSKIRDLRCMITDPDGRFLTDMMDEIGTEGPGGIDPAGGGPSVGPGGGGPGPGG